MTLSDFIAQSYLRATGTVSTLTSSDSDWTKLLQLANIFQTQWAKEPGVDWVSLYSPAVSCGTITATDTFNLDSSIYKISQGEDDAIRIDWTDGTHYTDYTLVSPERLKYYTTGNYVAKIGSTLKFNKTFAATDKEFGGTIHVPAYTLPSDLANSSDVVMVDIPDWLVTRCAAEYVRNDLVKQNQYPNLIAEANELMKKMIENNNAQLETVTLRPTATARTF